MLRRTSIICLEILIGIVTLLAIIAAIFVWRLSQGPVSISFLMPYVDDFLRENKSPVQPKINDLIITWGGWDRALDIRALGMKLVDQENKQPVMQIGEVSISLSVSALVRGKLAPTSLEVIRPTMYVVRTETGKLQFGMDKIDKATANHSRDILSALMTELSGKPKKESKYRYLNRVSLVGAVLYVDDQPNSITWGARYADITIKRSEGGVRSFFDLDLNFEGESISIEGRAYFNRIKRDIAGSFKFKGLNPKTLGDTIPSFSDLRMLRSNFSGEIDFRSNVEGRLHSLRFKTAGNAGIFSAPKNIMPPVPFSNITMVGDLTRNPDRIRFQKLSVNTEKISATLKGEIKRLKNTAHVTASIAVPSIPIKELYKYWPAGLGQNARPWLIEHIREGKIKNGAAKFQARVNIGGENYGAVQVDSLNGLFKVKKVSVSPVKTIQPITKLSGSATFDEKRLIFTIKSGEMGLLKFSDGSVKINNVDKTKEILSVTALVSGPVKATAEYLSNEKLNLFSRFGLSYVGTAGTHLTRFQISLPLLNSLTTSDITLVASSKLKGLTVQNVFLGQPISSGDLSLDIINEQLSAVGSVRYANTPTSLNWTEDLSGTRRIKRRVEARLSATSSIRRAIGVEFPKFLKGTVESKLIYEQQQNGKATVSADLDLTNARIWIPGFDWPKPSGRPAQAKIKALLHDTAISSIPFFSLDSNILSIAGNLAFSDKIESGRKTLEVLNLNHFKLGSTNFTATLKRDINRSLFITVLGRGFDATPLLDKKLNELKFLNASPFGLNAAFRKFWIGPGPPANNVNLKLTNDGNLWQRIEIDGILPDGRKPLSIKMIPTDEGHKLSIYSADAGALLKAADMTNSVKGGSIEISGVRKGARTGPWNGVAEMKRFNLSNAPIFARLMSLASLSGINNALSGKGIKFRRLRFGYRYHNEIVTINDALAVGSELGITARGLADFRKDMININGTIVPAYTLNSLIGKVPILGSVLTGEKGGGILGAAYEIKGPLEYPKMKVNPLSAFAPGFLRHFFKFGSKEKTKQTAPSRD